MVLKSIPSRTGLWWQYTTLKGNHLFILFVRKKRNKTEKDNVIILIRTWSKIRYILFPLGYYYPQLMCTGTITYPIALWERLVQLWTLQSALLLLPWWPVPCFVLCSERPLLVVDAVNIFTWLVILYCFCGKAPSWWLKILHMILLQPSLEYDESHRYFLKNLIFFMWWDGCSKIMCYNLY